MPARRKNTLGRHLSLGSRVDTCGTTEAWAGREDTCSQGLLETPGGNLRPQVPLTHLGLICSISATSCWVLFLPSASCAKFTLKANLSEVYFSGRRHLPHASVSQRGERYPTGELHTEASPRTALRAKRRAAVAACLSGVYGGPCPCLGDVIDSLPAPRQRGLRAPTIPLTQRSMPVRERGC